jgi:hypothetical protein
MDTRNRAEQQGNIYQIVVQGQLDQNWSTWFEELEISHIEGEVAPLTILTGPFVDQAALRGVLTKLWDLRLTLISVTKIDNIVD